MSGALLRKERETHYTYSDYVKWDTDTRFELIRGIPKAMSSPTVSRQRVCVQMLLQLGNFLKGKPCEVFVSPLDVRLNASTKDDTVVQPDIIVVCDKSKIENKKSCAGAPDMVAEVLSPSNRNHDLLVKYNLYLEAGVKEYWVVNTEDKIVNVHLLDEGRYYLQPYGRGATVPVNVLPGCEINLGEVFEEEEPENEDHENETPGE